MQEKRFVDALCEAATDVGLEAKRTPSVVVGGISIYILNMQPEPKDRKPDFYDWIGYVLAAAILLPLAWWLKAADPLGLTEFFAQFFGH